MHQARGTSSPARSLCQQHPPRLVGCRKHDHDYVISIPSRLLHKNPLPGASLAYPPLFSPLYPFSGLFVALICFC